MAALRSSRALVSAVFGAAVLVAMRLSTSAFVPPPAAARTPTLGGLQVPAAAAAGLLAPALVGAPPAVAGEPPSVGDHWYWDLGFGSLHGETASIILMVFFLLVVFSLLGAGGSSKKSTA
mmetsp:Transcript_38302/g.77103  ORF Transcript_38302/g.77103 Transcript_38302/m.77103 type:complete len:120 (-) Transcript_38302:124-483(-)